MTNTSSMPMKGGASYRFIGTPAHLDDRPVRTVTEGDLSPDQKLAYRAIRKWLDKSQRDELLTFGGYAGTGKTTLVTLVANQYRNLRIAFCALTGKAVSVLRQKMTAAGIDLTYCQTGTIHQLIYFPRMDDDGGVTSWCRRASIDADLIIVDEASMLDRRIFEDLSSFGVPILAVGDHGQLPPVFNDGFGLMNDPMLRLEKIHRQAAGNPILRLSEYIRNNGVLPEKLTEDPRVRFTTMGEYEADLVAMYSKPLTSYELSQLGILCYTNEMRQMLNTAVREVRFGAKEDTPPQAGDQVMCLRNNAPIYNGMRGNIREVRRSRRKHHAEMDVLFEDEGLLYSGDVSRYQFGRAATFKNFSEVAKHGFETDSWEAVGLLLDYGYSLTVHKSQGSQFDKVVTICERPGTVPADTYRRWLYTACTRASKELVLIKE